MLYCEVSSNRYNVWFSNGPLNETEKDFRYITRSPTAQEDLTIVAYVGKNHAVFQQGGDFHFLQCSIIEVFL